MDAADDSDDVVEVATGVYTGVSARAGMPQVVYVSKVVTINDGCTITTPGGVWMDTVAVTVVDTKGR